MPRELWIILLGVGAIGSIFVFIAWSERRRIRDLTTALAQLGLDAWPKPSPDQQDACFRQVHTPSAWRDGPTGIVWAARGSLHGQRVVVFEHRYSTGSGKGRRVHTHTVAAVVDVRGLPTLIAREKRWGADIARALAARLTGAQAPATTGDEAFDRVFEVEAMDPNALLSVLTPRVRAWLLARPGNDDALLCGPDGLGVYRRGSIDPAKIEDFARLPGEVFAALTADARSS